MRHRKAGVKLNRTASHRKAMFRNMVTSLFKYDRIKTTDVKAKELRKWADNLITLAKRGDLHARRQALSIIREKDVVHKLFEEAAEKYAGKNGGYTRIIKLGRRPGDAAPISIIELISAEEGKKKKKKAKTEKAKEVIKEETAAEDRPDETDEVVEPAEDEENAVEVSPALDESTEDAAVDEPATEPDAAEPDKEKTQQ